MQKDTYTIVVFPGSTGSPKRIQLSKKSAKVALISLLVVFLSFGGAGIYFVNQYLNYQDGQVELASLKRQEKIQKTQIDKFSKQVRSFETEMSRLESFEKKLRIITSFENSPKGNQGHMGVGGPYGLSSHSFHHLFGKRNRIHAGSLVRRFGYTDEPNQNAPIQFSGTG